MSEENFNPQAIIVDWCNRISRSITRRDLEEHMQHVSEKVRIYGVPGYKQLTFFDWEKRRSHEFRHNLIDTLTYKLNRIKTSTPVRIQFHAEETMQGVSGQVIILDKEITLELHPQRKLWQVVEENIKNWGVQE
ncbi:MAG: hypothetical protein P8Y24_01485 [Gammaproteobacteria bacterium]|jgi:hypothetical protein